MSTMRILAIVLAGGRGTRLHPLTANHAKPALALVDGCRLVDFVLSNLVNSGIRAIHVMAQYKPRSLVEHIDKTWTRAVRGPGCFVDVVLADPDGRQEPFLGTADAVYQNLSLVQRYRPDVVAIFAADHVYRMDVRQMVDFHIHSRAAVSVSAVPVPVEQASAFGIIAACHDGRIEDFEEKPTHPTPMPTNPGWAYASMGNYLFNPDALCVLLEEAHARGDTDFGHHIMPNASRTYPVFAYDFSTNRVPGLRRGEQPGYWRDVGTLAAFRQAQEDVTGSRPRFRLANPYWPMRGDPLTRLADVPPHSQRRAAGMGTPMRLRRQAKQREGNTWT